MFQICPLTHGTQAEDGNWVTCVHHNACNREKLSGENTGQKQSDTSQIQLSRQHQLKHSCASWKPVCFISLQFPTYNRHIVTFILPSTPLYHHAVPVHWVDITIIVIQLSKSLYQKEGTTQGSWCMVLQRHTHRHLTGSIAVIPG